MFALSIFWFTVKYVIVWVPYVLEALALALVFRVRALRRLRLPMVALTVATLGVSLYAMWRGCVYLPDVERKIVEWTDLPREFDGYRILHVSDIHASWLLDATRQRRIVEKINAVKPDLVCITGDFADGVAEERAGDLAPLADLRAADGVYGCTGNHEYYGVSGCPKWVRLLEGFGVKMLSDRSVTLRRGKATIALGGVSDYPYGIMDRQTGVFLVPSIDPVFKQTPVDAFRVLMQHQPLTLARARKANVRLQLSGHTHGGQVPGGTLLSKWMNEGHLAGFYAEGEGTSRIWLHVTRGIGLWTGLPFRLFAPPEIALLELRRARGE